MELGERLPALRDTDRHLVELAPSPWQSAQIIAPHRDWLAPLLRAMGHDRRPCYRNGNPAPRTLEIITPHPDVPRIQRACTEHLFLSYLLRVISADVPSLLPPLLILDQSTVLTLGESELRPLPVEVGRRQIQAVPLLLMAGTTLVETRISGGTRGGREPSAGDGRHHRVYFDTSEGNRYELELEALDDDQWRMELRALGAFEVPRRLRVIDAGGQVWLESGAGYLPWQGRKVFPAQDPAALLGGLTLEPQEDDDEGLE